MDDRFKHEFVEWDNPFDKMILDDGHCFLCGAALGTGGTREHILPKWLLEKHSLWNQELNLLNGTSIRYRQLTVPCCAKCNNEDVSDIERMVGSAFNDGYEGVSALDELLLFQWAGKIFFALLFKELGLLLDRADPKRGTILTPDFLAQLDIMHGLLQSVYRPVEIVGNPPFSILVANLHRFESPDDFFLHDDLFHLTFALRSNNVGIIAAFEDGGINKRSYGQYLRDVAGRKLHPVQFDELFAKVTYNTRRLNRAPKYMFSIPKDKRKPYQVRMLPLGGLSRRPIVDRWNQSEYAPMLASAWEKWGFDVDFIFQPPDLVRSYMQDEEGKLLLLDEHGDAVQSRNPENGNES